MIDVAQIGNFFIGEFEWLFLPFLSVLARSAVVHSVVFLVVFFVRKELLAG